LKKNRSNYGFAITRRAGRLIDPSELEPHDQLRISRNSTEMTDYESCVVATRRRRNPTTRRLSSVWSNSSPSSSWAWQYGILQTNPSPSIWMTAGLAELLRHPIKPASGWHELHSCRTFVRLTKTPVRTCQPTAVTNRSSDIRPNALGHDSLV